MSRTKGTQKTGGRELGTPNRVTADLRNCIEQLVNDNIEQIKTDFTELEAKDRLIIFERLLQYVIPKKREEEQVNNDHRSEFIKRMFNNDFQYAK